MFQQGLVWSEKEIEIFIKCKKEGMGRKKIVKELKKSGFFRTIDSVRHKEESLVTREVKDKIFSRIGVPENIISKTTINKIVARQYLDLIKEGLKEFGLLEKKNVYKINKRYLSKSETLVLILSDTHIGKRIKFNGIESYNLETYEKYIRLLENNFFDTYYRHIKNDRIIDEIIIAIAGDMLDGELIYQTQQSQIDTNVVKQLIHSTKSLWRLIDRISNVNKKIPIRIICVKGNHGRINETNEESNWDLALYYQLKFISDVLKRKNVFFEISDEKSVTFSVKGHRCLMRHEMPKDATSNSNKHKFGGWNAQKPFDFAISGHWHRSGFEDWCDKPIFFNGSLCGADDLSDSMGTGNKPHQWIFGVTEKRVPTFLYRLDCKE